MPNLVGIGNSQVPTNAMLGGLAYQDPAHVVIKEADITSIASIKAKNLERHLHNRLVLKVVELFLYMTLEKILMMVRGDIDVVIFLGITKDHLILEVIEKYFLVLL